MISVDALEPNVASDEVKDFAFHLMNDPLFLPDYMKNYSVVIRRLKAIFAESAGPLRAIKKDGTLVGVFGVIDIIPETDARFVCWIWGTKVLTPGLVKSMRDFLSYIKQCYSLRRVTTQSACDRMCRLLELVGFKIEGRFRHGFKWGGRFSNLYQLRVIGEV